MSSDWDFVYQHHTKWWRINLFKLWNGVYDMRWVYSRRRGRESQLIATPQRSQGHWSRVMGEFSAFYSPKPGRRIGASPPSPARSTPPTCARIGFSRAANSTIPLWCRRRSRVEKCDGFGDDVSVRWYASLAAPQSNVASRNKCATTCGID